MIKRIIQGSLVLALLAIGQNNLWADNSWRSFSADMVSVTNGQQVEGKIFIGQGKTRMEMPQGLVIVRQDKNVSWVFMPADKMYMEQPIDPKMVSRTQKDMPGEIERVALGPEIIGGQNTTKYKVTYQKGPGQETMFQWIGDSEIPVKMESADGSWSVQYKNIKMGAPDDSLFEIPGGYQKVEIPSMAAMQAAMQKADKNE